VEKLRATLPSAWGFLFFLGFIIALGACLRLFLPAGFTGVGFDENLYRTYIGLLNEAGLLNYPVLIEEFLRNQLNPANPAILPPTRLVYILGGAAYQHAFNLQPLAALHALSCHFSILALVVSAIFCWRLTHQRAFTAAVTALVACAPTQIHLGQHALIDGVFSFWALLAVWLLWENLRHPNDRRWLIAYGAGLAFLVMTKESASFVFVALLGIIVSNRWLDVGKVTRLLLITTFLGAFIGFAAVIVAAGGVEQFALVFSLLQQKVPVLPYTIKTGGGPWHRYLVDLILVSPIVVVLAVGNLLQSSGKRTRGEVYLITLCCLMYTLLASFPGGMNLRYILMLDMPLRVLAASQLFSLSAHWGRHKTAFLACALLFLCAYDLRQHQVLFAKGGLYELVTEGLLRAQDIMK